MKDQEPKPLFLLLDGSAIMHRAYHAMPPLTMKDGSPTGAVHGFFGMLLKLLVELNPSHVAICFDRPVPNFRQELYVGYQAQRPKVESDLGDQFTIVRKILMGGKVPVYEVDGFEADDLIGTIATKVAHGFSHIDTYIITGDRDMLQLIRERVHILMPIKGISEVMIFDEKRVVEKYGVTPGQFIDYKALTGDASDNYPGVAGVGPKTASTLLSSYKTLDGIYSHLEEIKKKNPKLALKLAEGAESAGLAKKLATIVCDAPFNFLEDDCKIKHLIEGHLLEELEKYELKTTSKRFKDYINGVVNNSKTQMKLL